MFAPGNAFLTNQPDYEGGITSLLADWTEVAFCT